MLFDLLKLLDIDTRKRKSTIKIYNGCGCKYEIFVNLNV